MLNEETVLKVAKLAKLAITPEEAAGFQKQLEKVLTYFSELGNVNTDGVEPLVTPIPVETYLRDDVVIQELTAEDILKNAPQSQGNLFKVPPVV